MAIYDANRWLKSIILDDEDMTANSEDKIVSQRSVVAYIANQLVIAAGLNEAQAQALIDEALITLTIESSDVTDFDSAVQAVITAFGAVTQSELTSQLAQNTADSISYTDQEIAALYIDSSSGAPNWEQDIRLYDSIPIMFMKVNGNTIREPSFEKYIDDGSGSDGIWAYNFDNSKENELLFSYLLNCQWKMGSVVYPVVRWISTADGNAGDKVRWGMEVAIHDFDSTTPNSALYEGSIHQPIETIQEGELYVTILPPLATGGLLPSAEILGRVFRDPGHVDDTLSQDVYLISFGFAIQVDKPGQPVDNLPFVYIAE